MKTLGVVGAGIIGLSAALHFARRGWRVTVFDADPSKSASQACQGISSIKGHRDPRDPLFVAKFWGHYGLARWLAELESAANSKINYKFSGVFEPYLNRADYAWLCERIFHRRWSGFMDFKHLNVAEMTKMLPASVLQKPSGAFYFPRDGWFDTTSLLDALIKASLTLGVDFKKTKVVQVAAGDGIVRLHAEKHTQTFDHCVMAAGAGTSQLLAACKFASPPLELHHGASFCFKSKIYAAQPYAVTYGKHSLLHQGHTISVGASSWRDHEIPQLDGAAFLRSKLSVINAENVDLNAAKVRVGTRVRTKSQRPDIMVLGSRKQPRIIVMTGFYKNGFQLAHLAAQTLWQLVHSEDLSYPFSEFVSCHND